MKFKVFFSFFLVAFAGVVFAQDENEHIRLKNEGNVELRVPNYQKALELYEASVALWPEDAAQDAAMIYNMAECARRLNDNDKALTYYTQSKTLNYRPDRAAYNMALIMKTLNREEEMEQLLVESIENNKESTILAQKTRMLVTYYLTQGAEHYNRAAQILASAANANPSQYDEINQRANESFSEAKPWFEKALKYDPENANAINSLKEINSRK